MERLLYTKNKTRYPTPFSGTFFGANLLSKSFFKLIDMNEILPATLMLGILRKEEEGSLKLRKVSEIIKN